MSVQVVRTLVYTYPDHETAEKDMAMWNIPATGVRRNGRSGSIHSATTPLQTFKETIETAAPVEDPA